MAKLKFEENFPEHLWGGYARIIGIEGMLDSRKTPRSNLTLSKLASCYQRFGWSGDLHSDSKWFYVVLGGTNASGKSLICRYLREMSESPKELENYYTWLPDLQVLMVGMFPERSSPKRTCGVDNICGTIGKGGVDYVRRLVAAMTTLPAGGCSPSRSSLVIPQR